jgi:selenocysteine lyase/cysteine desulfurase
MGREAVYARILELVRALRDGLVKRGWRIATPEPLASGILAAAHPSKDARTVAKALEERGVIVAPREANVRFSPHAGNDLDQVARVLAAIDALD